MPLCDDDDDEVKFDGNVLNCICGRICKLREEYEEFRAAELSREPCCEPLLECGPSAKEINEKKMHVIQLIECVTLFEISV